MVPRRVAELDGYKFRKPSVKSKDDWTQQGSWIMNSG